MGVCGDLLVLEAVQNLVELSLVTVDRHGGALGVLGRGLGDLRGLPQLDQLVQGLVVDVVGLGGEDVDVRLSLLGLRVVLEDGQARLDAGAVQPGVVDDGRLCLLYTSDAADE